MWFVCRVGVFIRFSWRVVVVLFHGKWFLKEVIGIGNSSYKDMPIYNNVLGLGLSICSAQNGILW